MINTIRKIFIDFKIGDFGAIKNKIEILPSFLADALGITIALPFIVLIRVISPIVLIKFQKIENMRIGHFTMDSSFFLGNEPKKFREKHLFFFTGKSSNLYWEQLVKKELKVCSIVKYLFYANLRIPGSERHIVPSNPISRDLNGYYRKVQRKFVIGPDDHIKAINWLKEFGWKEGDKIICLLVRDSGYLKEHIPGVDYSYHSYRDSNSEDYEQAIDYILSKGYWLIRTGKIANKKVNNKHSQLIDYPFLENKPDLLDIWLALNSFLFISTGAGIDMLPSVYNHPTCLFLNFLPLLNIHSFQNCITTPKHLKRKSTGEFLNLHEHLSSYFFNSDEYSNNDLDIIDLTKEEILNAVIESLERLEGKWIETRDDSENQKKFWDILRLQKNYQKLHNWIHPEAKLGTHYLRKMKDSLFV